MKTKLLGLIAASLLFMAWPHAHAATIYIDLNSPGGVPGTGGTEPYFGPCYCFSSIYYSPVYLVSAGDTVDFGRVTNFWWQSGPTPDAGPYQPGLFLLSPVVATFNPPPTFPFPSLAFCEYGAVCSFPPVTTDLTYGIPSGDSSIQLAWYGPYDYVAPTPLPAALPLFATGLGVMGLFGWRRKRKAAGRR